MPSTSFRREADVELPPGCRLSIEERPAETDIDALGQGLDAYNQDFLGPTNYVRIVMFVRDEAGTVRGGLDSAIYAGWLFVKLLWVHADLRRRGIGREMLTEAERRALALGCHSVRLDTFSFQAPEFYRKLGYREFARLDYPPDHERIFLRKQLAPAPE
jgi:GNAT superfamily N-acetyltransferase